MPQAGPHQHFTGGQVVSFEPSSMPQAPHYYSPSGMIHVVGMGEQQSAASPGAAPAKPATAGQAAVRHYAASGTPEQYGQPESAAIPPNYKPFGSWGLYIGGNPADGYYSNYYKALSSSVSDKQQVAGGESSPAKPAGSQAFVGQASGFGGQSPVPTMKQGPFYPQSVAYQDQAAPGYPYGEYYTPADLNSGSRVTVQNQMMPAVYSAGFVPAASSAGPTEYQAQPPSSSAAVFAPAAMYYGAEQYAAGKKSPPSAQAFGTKDVQAPASPATKGFQQAQQRMGYAYASQSSGAFQSPASAGQPASYQPASYQPSSYQPSSYQPAQVVAYPVPVGSQMVGTQPGAEGSFQPYGVHAFTRYAVKPTVVSTEQAYYATGVHSAPASQFPAYKQQFVGYQQPMGFYGFPLSQLHYSTGGPAAFGSQTAAASNAPTTVSVGPVGSPMATFTTSVQHPVGQQVGAVEHSGPAMHSSVVDSANSEKSEANSEADKQHQVNNKQQQQKRA
jgi:hypothetical protein